MKHWRWQSLYPQKSPNSQLISLHCGWKCNWFGNDCLSSWNFVALSHISFSLFGLSLPACSICTTYWRTHTADSLFIWRPLTWLSMERSLNILFPLSRRWTVFWRNGILGSRIRGNSFSPSLIFWRKVKGITARDVSVKSFFNYVLCFHHVYIYISLIIVIYFLLFSLEFQLS